MVTEDVGRPACGASLGLNVIYAQLSLAKVTVSQVSFPGNAVRKLARAFSLT